MLKLCRIHFEFRRSRKNGLPGSGMRKAIKADFEQESVAPKASKIFSH